MRRKIWLAAIIVTATLIVFVSVRQAQQAPPDSITRQTPVNEPQSVDDTNNSQLEANSAGLDTVGHTPIVRDGDLTVIMDRGNVRVSERYFNCSDDGCDSELIIDNPYEGLSMDELQAIAVADSTAAFQFAVKRYAAAETKADVDVAVEYAMRSVALAPSSDVSWMYNAFIEHFHLTIGENSELGDDQLRSALIWHLAGEKLQLVESRYVENVRQELINLAISLDGLEEAATEFALELQGLRLSLTGEPTAANGEYL